MQAQEMMSQSPSRESLRIIEEYFCGMRAGQLKIPIFSYISTSGNDVPADLQLVFCLVRQARNRKQKGVTNHYPPTSSLNRVMARSQESQEPQTCRSW